MTKKLAFLPVLALAALTAAACGDKNDDANGGDTTAVAPGTTDTTGMAAPAPAPMPAGPMDSTGGTMTDTGAAAGAPGTNQQDTLIKVDSMAKKP